MTRQLDVHKGHTSRLILQKTTPILCLYS